MNLAELESLSPEAKDLVSAQSPRSCGCALIIIMIPDGSYRFIAARAREPPQCAARPVQHGEGDLADDVGGERGLRVGDQHAASMRRAEQRDDILRPAQPSGEGARSQEGGGAADLAAIADIPQLADKDIYIWKEGV